MSFGSAIHNTLEVLNTKYFKKYPSFEEVKAIWQNTMAMFTHCFSAAHFKAYENYGIEVVNNYIKNIWKAVDVAPLCEKMLYNSFEGLRIKGKIDRIDVQSNAIRIIDYKTGWNQTPKPFQSEEDAGNSFWRQAAIYEQLIKKEYPAHTTIAIEFHFVEHNKTVSFITGEDNGAWKLYLEKVWKQITLLQFQDKCSNPECPHCLLVKEMDSWSTIKNIEALGLTMLQ